MDNTFTSVRFYLGLNISPENGGTSECPRWQNTERLRTTIAKTLARMGFPGCTITTATGYWEGQAEETLVIECLTNDPAPIFLADDAAKLLAVEYRQTCVAVSLTPCSVAFIASK